MKKLALPFTYLLFCSITLNSQTTIPVGDVSGSWEYSGSPYLIDGEITVPDGQALTIDPGLSLNFRTAGNHSLTLNGRNLLPGIYFYQFKTGKGYTDLLKMQVIR